MATAQELQDQYDALEQKRADLYNRMQDLSDQHASSKASLLGHDFAAMDKIRFNSALQPLRAQDRVIHQQQAALKSELLKADRDTKLAAGAPAAAAKAQLAQQKAQNDAQKIAAGNLEDASARAFGLGPKKGIDYVTQQGAFYDPSRGAIAVPDTKSAKVAAQKAAKGDAQAGKQVQAEVSGFAKQAGVQGPVSPASFFGDNGFEMEQDKDGNYVYDANGTQVTIPEETAKRLQEQYNSSLAPVQEDAQLPTTGVKYIPVNTFQQANQQLNQIKGTNVVDPVEYQLARQNRNYLAQPAIQQALGNSPTPRVIPATTIAGQVVPEATPARTAVPSIEPGADIPTVVNAPSAMAYLNSGVNPVFADIAARRKAVALAPVAEANKYAGALSPKEIKDETAKAIDLLGPDATQEQVGIATKARLDAKAAQNQAPSSGYDMAAKGAGVVGTNLLTALENSQPQMVVDNAIRKGIDYLSPRASSSMGGILDALPTDRSLPQKMADLQKRFAIDVGTGAIPPSTKQEDYVNFFLNGPQPTNPDSARYVPPTE